MVKVGCRVVEAVVVVVLRGVVVDGRTVDALVVARDVVVANDVDRVGRVVDVVARTVFDEQISMLL